jgi:hypothetical protein
MTLDGVDRSGHSLWCGHITQPPTCHGVGFAESVDRDCEIVRLLRERRDAHVFGVVINKLLVNFIGQDVNVLLGGDLHNCL